MELLYSPSEIAESAQPEVLEKAAIGADAAHGEILLEVENLSFRYPTRPESLVLDNISFHVAPGEMVAVVGPSGAGKSTLFDLIQRFYNPAGGVIRFNGIPATDLKLADVRGCVGYVPQDPVMFSGTLRDNLTYARADASQAQIEEAMRVANAYDFVMQLPDKLDTRVGEDGVGLSGGQRQRLAIARALLSAPSILLLDEATSALDADSEHQIRQSIERLKGQMTIMVIAHRLSTVRQANRILVLEGGQLVDAGSHEELLTSSPLYARFAKMQFAA